MKKYIKLVIRILKNSPFEYLVTIFLYFIIYIFQPIELELTQQIINKISSRVDLLNVFLIVMGLVLIYTVKSVNSMIEGYVGNKIQYTISKECYNELLDKLFRESITNFDKSDFLNKLYRAKCAIDNELKEFIMAFIKLFLFTFSLLVIGKMIIEINYIYACLLFLIFIMQNIYIIFVSKSNISIARELDIRLRKKQYYKELFQKKENLKDIKSNDLNEWISKKYVELLEEKEKIHFRFIRKWNFISVIWSFIMYGLEVVLLLVLIFEYNKNNIEIGGVVLILQSHEMVLSNAFSLSGIITSLMEKSVYIKDFLQVIEENVEEEKASPIYADNIVLKLQNINYSYREEREVLHNISLEIKENELVFIVGENGCGKSTLAKIICGLLQPSSGRIERDNGLKVSAVFQDYSKFKFTLRENIGFGDLKELDNDDKIKKNLELYKNQILNNKNINGLDTFMGKEFHEKGVEVSEGEWQRISICRACFMDYDLLVLDEAMSAIDPESEIEQFDLIRKNKESAALILITHRIGLAKYADKIVFLKNGEISEMGTHDELIENRGEYEKFYKEQAKWYE